MYVYIYIIQILSKLFIWFDSSRVCKSLCPWVFSQFQGSSPQANSQRLANSAGLGEPLIYCPLSAGVGVFFLWFSQEIRGYACGVTAPEYRPVDR